MPSISDFSLYNLAPVGQLLAVGLLVALGPLIWIGIRNRRATPMRRLQALTVLILFLTFDLVMFGAFTRLTDSGLGCPDWPGCYGHSTPVGANLHIAAAQEAMPSGPVTHTKAWVEMVHRYLATGVGALILLLTILSFFQARARWLIRTSETERLPKILDAREGTVIGPLRWWALATLVWVCVQGAFGALTVTMKLFPAIVVLHLMGAYILLGLLCVQAARYRLMLDHRTQAVLGNTTRNWMLIAAVFLVLQLLLGGWVSTNYAVLACTTFPTCQGSWWPSMDFQQAFTLWRPLGQMPDGSYLNFSALTTIHYTHRLSAYLLFAVLAVLVVRLAKHRSMRLTAWVIGTIALLQAITGLANVVLDWPLLAAVLHTGGAGALVVALVWGLATSRRSSPVLITSKEALDPSSLIPTKPTLSLSGATR